jgi:hypothetical protein
MIYDLSVAGSFIPYENVMGVGLRFIARQWIWLKSFILHLLDKPEFRKLYMAGGFDPGQIMEFGKSHGIIINCWGDKRLRAR